jgi:hypothetical protein
MQRLWSFGLMVLFIGVLQFGCVSMPETLDEKAAAANEIGKFVTLVYLSEKDRVDPEGIVGEVYRVFSEVLKATDANTLPVLFRSAVEEQIRKQVKDVKQQQLALGLVSLYWDRLTAKVKLNKLTGSELLVVLKAFRQGVEEMRAVLKGPISRVVPGMLNNQRYSYGVFSQFTGIRGLEDRKCS